MGDSIGEGGYTLGTVVGQLTGIQRELSQQREDMQHDRQDRQREYGQLCERLGRLERTSGNWRWLERAGAVIGGALAGWFGGKVG